MMPRPQTLQSKLLFRFVGVSAISLFLMGVITVPLITTHYRHNYQSRLNDSLQGIKIDINERERSLYHDAKALNTDRRLADLLEQRDRQSLFPILKALRQLMDVDDVTAIDRDGVVLFRAHNPGRYGDTLPSNPETSSSSLIHGDSGIMFEVIEPISRQDGQIVGTIRLGRLLDHRFLEMVKAKYGVESVLLNTDHIQATTIHNVDILRSLMPVHDTTSATHPSDSSDHFASYLHLYSDNGDDIGCLIVAISNHPVRTAGILLSSLFGITAVFLCGSIAILGYRFSRDIVAPISRLVEATNHVAKGDFNQSVEVTAEDEIGVLTNSMNQMIRRLKESTTSIDLLNAEASERKQAEESLRESEDRFRTLAEAMPQLVWATTADGALTYFNQRGLDYLGRAHEQLEGWSWQSIIHPDDLPGLLEQWNQSLETGETYEAEARIEQGKSGHFRWHLVRGLPLRNQEGQVGQWVGSCTDIHDLKLAEEAIKESELRYRSLYNNTPVMMHSIDSQGRLVSVNDHWLRTLGYERDEVIGQLGVMFLAEGSRQCALDTAIPQLLEEDSVQDIEYQMVKKNGQVIDVLLSATMGPESPKGSRQSQAFILDVTDRKRAEVALRESSEAYRLVTDNMPALIAFVGSDGCFKLVNRGYCDWFGLPLDQIVGKRPVDIMGQETFHKVQGHLRTALRGNTEHFEIQVPNREQELRWLSVTYVPKFADDGQVDGIFSLILDIDDQKKDSEALRRSEQEYRSIFENHNFGITVTDDQYRIIRVNDAMCQMLGYSKDELYRMSVSDITLPEDMEESHTALKRMSEERHDDVAILQKRYVRKDGSVLEALVTVKPFYDGDGHYTYSVATIQDITDRVRAERALKMTQYAVDKSSSAIYWISQDWNLVYVNDSACNALGYTRQQLLQMSVSDIDPDYPEMTWSNRWETLWNAGSITFESRHRRSDGTTFPVEIRSNPIEFDNIKYIFSFSNDITDRKQAEAEIHQLNEELEQRVKQRTADLEEVNQELETFTYSISHDLKAPLRAIEGFSDALAEDYGAALDETAKEFLHEISDGAVRMAQLIQDLLSHAGLGRGAMKATSVPLFDVVNRAMENLSAEIRASDAKITVDKTLPTIQGHRSILELMAQNLLSNAIKFVQPEVKPIVHISLLKDNDADCLISVHDNGIGFKEEYFKTIFQIFNRLHGNEAYPGTGIGLAIVDKAVRLHDGRVWVESEPGQGSTFFIQLSKHVRSDEEH